jgi:hypothetical protein
MIDAAASASDCGGAPKPPLSVRGQNLEARYRRTRIRVEAISRPRTAARKNFPTRRDAAGWADYTRGSRAS